MKNMKSKYIKSVLIILFGTLILSSCSDFLNTNPSDFISPENFFNTEAEGDMAIAGVYQSVNELYKTEFKNTFSATTDETFYYRLGGEQMQEKTFNATTPTIYNIWSKLYTGIYKANFFLENVDRLNVSDEKKNAFRAEARFLRGYFYYHLAMLFGDVPLRWKAIDSPLNTQIARSPRAEVFDSVCSDLNYAINNLYTYTAPKSPVRASREAATGVLGRVYLSMAGVLGKPEYFEKTRDLLLPLVQSGVIHLNPDYTQIWKNISADAYDHVSKEIMFDCEFSADPYKYIYYGWGSNVTPAAPVGTLTNPNDWYRVTTTLWQYYQSDVNDVRYTWNICNYSGDTKTPRPVNGFQPNGSNATECNAGKFRRDWETSTTKDSQKNGHNFPVLRYSDVLLMLSEAENEVNGPTALAFAGLDSVRSRAKAFKYSTSPLKPTIKEDFRNIIIQERSRELCFESTTRYYDLIRWGIIIDKFTEVGNTMKLLGGSNGANWANRLYYVIKPYHLLLPIPQLEMQLNPLMKQNPGY
jgi:hypothetical protein